MGIKAPTRLRSALVQEYDLAIESGTASEKLQKQRTALQNRFCLSCRFQLWQAASSARRYGSCLDGIKAASGHGKFRK